MQRKTWYSILGLDAHASFPQKPVVKTLLSGGNSQLVPNEGSKILAGENK